MSADPELVVNRPKARCIPFSTFTALQNPSSKKYYIISNDPAIVEWHVRFITVPIP